MFATQTNKTKNSADEKARQSNAPAEKTESANNPAWQAIALSAGGIQKKLAISQPDDPSEQEADRVADQVMRMATPPSSNSTLSFSLNSSGEAQRKCAPCEGEEEKKLQRKESAPQPPVSGSSTADTLPSGPGQQLDSATRDFFEPRFGQDFSGVRVHTEGLAAESARGFNALAYTLRQNIVFGAGQFAPQTPGGRRLLAHELTHVVQQGAARTLNRDSRAGSSSAPSGANQAAGENSATAAPAAGITPHGGPPFIQRYIALTTPALGRHLMTAPQRTSFIVAHIAAGDRALARRVLDDMAAAADEFDFADERELELELRKRVATSEIMQETQTGPGRNAFGYPFNPPADIYGPRVNYAARTFWTPLPPDGYVDRSRDARAATARRTPRDLRHTVFGDMGHYEWSLTAAGIADFNQALLQLFVPQPQVYKRSLLHCDYLVSLVHFRALADAIGAAPFNAAARAYGANNLKLRWNLYYSLYADNFSTFRWWVTRIMHPTRAPAAALGSLAEVVPSSIADLVIGDHVFFWNHKAYDALNARIGNAWRLENAILIDRPRGNDLFLGHGSGRKTERQMREKLAQEYNQVADIALGLVRQIGHGTTATQSRARAELARRFPNVAEDGGGWWIRKGGFLGFFLDVDQPLRRITATEVPGLHDPDNPSRMYPVHRPAESRR